MSTGAQSLGRGECRSNREGPYQVRHRFRFGHMPDTTGNRACRERRSADASVKLLVTMTKLLRTLATAAAVPAIAGVALAGTATADPPLLNGTYRETDGDSIIVYIFATSCGPAGCTGTVASNQGWQTPTRLSGGRWVFTVSKPGGLVCDDGHYEPAVVSMSVDPVTLSGVLSSDSNFGCEGGIVTQSPFQLQKVG